MRLRLASAILAVPFWLPVQPSGVSALSAAPYQKSPENRKKAAPKSTTITGCIDEKKDLGYVLVEDKTLRTIAVLRAEGFPQEGLAKYLGTKVKVQGRTSSEGERMVVNVQRVEKISDSCSPAQ